MTSSLSPGAICTIPRSFGTRLWVAVEPVGDHFGAFSRWRMRCKRVDGRGRPLSPWSVHGLKRARLLFPALKPKPVVCQSECTDLHMSAIHNRLLCVFDPIPEIHVGAGEPRNGNRKCRYRAAREW